VYASSCLFKKYMYNIVLFIRTLPQSIIYMQLTILKISGHNDIALKNLRYL